MGIAFDRRCVWKGGGTKGREIYPRVSLLSRRIETFELFSIVESGGVAVNTVLMSIVGGKHLGRP